MRHDCQETWWWNLLYINNFGDHLAPDDKPELPAGCMGVTWYMANDMQFYVISPLIIYPLWRCRRWMTGILYILPWVFVFSLIPFILTYIDKEPLGGEFMRFYEKPWDRFQPYIIGLFLGFILNKLKAHWL